MGRIEAVRRIDAPAARVFEVVSDVENFQRAVPQIVRVEFLSAQRRGVGTRFRETRRMGKREATVELEVRELVEGERVRIVSDAGGTLWDTVFAVRALGPAQAELTMVRTDTPHRLLARVATPLIRPMVRKAVERDLDAVKAYCERR